MVEFMAVKLDRLLTIGKEENAITLFEAARLILVPSHLLRSAWFVYADRLVEAAAGWSYCAYRNVEVRFFMPPRMPDLQSFV
jgi:hypothetical protein